MKVIGLTGGIASGKSTVARFLAELGAAVIDSDKLGHEALKPGTPTWCEIIATFGREILTGDDQIDRAKLGAMVFGKPELLAKLNGIMHPRLYEVARTRLEELRRQGLKVAVLEVPLLIEAGWQPLVDEVWVVMASEGTVLERLKGRNKLSMEEGLARIRSQLSTEERVKHADIVINTDCNLEEMRQKVAELWQRLIKE